jgi:Zn-dependent peptidase ImmA (M78 family)/DNA-binding XRE family transcriptional regulator
MRMLRSMETALGARIRAYRERAGLQSQELAVRLGIDPSAMSNIESGKRSVKTSELAKIAAALSVSPLALLDDNSLPARLQVAARPDGVQSTVKGAAYSRLLAVSELHDLLSGAGIETSSDLAEIPEVNQWAWKAAAEELAQWAIKRLDVQACGIKRFAALADAIEQRLRVDVLIEKYAGDPLSGATITSRDFPLIFVNSQHPTPRSLFTLAHELGHLLSGHDGMIAIDDNLAGTTPDERQANAFAAAFLMPADQVNEHIAAYGRGADSLARMIYDFGVSFESLIFRLHNLRKIDAAGRDSLHNVGWEGLLRVILGTDLRSHLGDEIITDLVTRQGRHPADRPPRWLTNRCFTGYQQGVISIRPLAGLLNVDPDDYLDRLHDDARSAKVLEMVEGPPAREQSSDDDLFAGSPVS